MYKIKDYYSIKNMFTQYFGKFERSELKSNI